jgi:anaerobic selenocysteine-containing dehydrogenase
LPELAQALQAGEVDTLIVLGANPVYSAPADLNWSAMQRRANMVIRLATHEDETASIVTAPADGALPRVLG